MRLEATKHVDDPRVNSRIVAAGTQGVQVCEQLGRAPRSEGFEFGGAATMRLQNVIDVPRRRGGGTMWPHKRFALVYGTARHANNVEPFPLLRQPPGGRVHHSF
jgi:hypothetical protein